MIVICLLFVLMAWFRMNREKEKERAKAKDAETRDKPAHPVAAVTTLSAAYVVFAAWTFVAWYRFHRPLARYRWGGDGWLGVKTYAGGADKFGHAWATMALARLGTYILTSVGGFRRGRASMVSAGLSEALFTGVEVNDGFMYEFSFSDLTGDSIGMVLALALDNSPRLRELFAYRVQYFPSRMYARKIAGTSPCPHSSCSRWNIAEDYSGQTYLAALHLGGIHAVRNKIGTASRFVDLAAGFQSRHYRPTPDVDIAKPIRQDVFLGLSFNAQGFFDWLLENRPSVAAQRARTITHGLFEVFNLPFASLPLLGTSRSGPVRAVKPPPPASALPPGSP